MAPENDQLLADSVRGLITSYHELNANCVDELAEEPSPLEFMRYVAQNRPFVIRGGASSWKSNRKWNAEYLKEVMAGQHVNVTITNQGNADAIVESEEDGSLIFVEPFEREELFSDVIAKVQAQEARKGDDDDGAEAEVIRYAQTQNDNLRNEYSSLFADVPRDIPFARIALQQGGGPDAVNFWLGSSRSTTSLHKDNYENVYVQVLGRKHFTLQPPVEAACVNEQPVPAAKYVPRGRTVEKEEELEEVDLHDLKVEMADPARMVNWALWDPDLPEVRPTAFSKLSQPVRVTLEPGDMLYLPAMWYHKVAQSCSDEGICVAVNYWYDMDFSGPFWSLFSFARSIGGIANGHPLTEKGGEDS